MEGWLRDFVGDPGGDWVEGSVGDSISSGKGFSRIENLGTNTNWG